MATAASIQHDLDKIKDLYNVTFDKSHFEYLYPEIIHLFDTDEITQKLLKDSNYLIVVALYHKCVYSDKNKMIRFLCRAIRMDNKNIQAMLLLAHHYKSVNNDDLTERYYEMAVEEDSVEAMLKLAEYYDEKNNNYLAKEYYDMAFEHKSLIGNDAEINKLGWKYYCRREYSKAVICFEMAIKNDYPSSINNMGWYHLNVTKNYPEAIKYFERAMKLNYSNSFNNMGWYHQTITKNYGEMMKYYLIAISINNNKSSNSNMRDFITKPNYKSALYKVIDKLFEYCFKYNIEYLKKIQNLDDIVRLNLNKKLMIVLYPHLDELPKLSTSIKEIIKEHMMLLKIVQTNELGKKLPPRILSRLLMY